MALAPLSPYVDGLRVGSLAEVTGFSEDLNGKFCLIVSFSEPTGFGITLLNGERMDLPGVHLKVPQDLGRPGLTGDSKSFDLVVGPRLKEEDLGEEIAACLFEKGFCVLKVCQKDAETAKAFEHVQNLGNDGKLQRLPEEIEEGYLGIGNKGKVMWRDAANWEADTDDCIKANDDFITKLGELIQPFALNLFGRNLDERTPALVSVSLTEDEEVEYPHLDSDDGVLGTFLRVYRSSLCKIVHFMGPASSTVMLESTGDERSAKLPFQQETVRLDMGPNTILLYDPSIFSYSCQCEEETLTLNASFVEANSDWIMDTFEGESKFLFEGTGKYGMVPEEKCNVMNTATRLMSNYDEPEGYRAGLYGGCDSGLQIPITRWDIHLYYNEDFDDLQPWQSPTKHQSIAEGVELFDNKYFEIMANDAKSMDPMQRFVLECGAHNLFKLGITKKVSNRNPHHAGCSVGLDKSDWDMGFIDKPPECQGGSNVIAVISNRFSFVFNMKGPNYVCDTACSASLCATHLAKFAMSDRVSDKLEFFVCTGVHLCLIPRFFAGGKGNTMNSPIGRCLTFNATASGYMRGDGCSGIVLKWGNLPDDKDAVWRASQMGQNGRSATLSAPNGLAQGIIIENAYTEAKCSPPESCIWSCHGTGTSLGDPIEVGAIRRIQIKEERDHSLAIITNKTHCGHLEGGAAMTSIVAATLLAKFMLCIPVNHLRQLNPNLEQSAFNAFYNQDMMKPCTIQGNVHVSSFGFGGTNGHLILWNKSILETPDVATAFMKRLKTMQPPEVRVNGSDPSQWEWDGPDASDKPGTKYKIEIASDDTFDTTIKWEKIEDGTLLDDGEDDFYCITGTFNDWDIDRLEDTNIIGMRTVTVDMPETGELQFRFLKNGNEDEIFYPAYDKCSKKAAPVLGPCKEDAGREKFVWLIEGEPGQTVSISLFICRGRRSISWKLSKSTEDGRGE
mmetsp:Transcript_25791/g.54438  ORF Transcript_25791/g.54438 Transcript_25791/m.54438 type:complete len:956 (-) Transcript_25791:102-2969(-)